jgi:hypothetical protein
MNYMLLIYDDPTSWADSSEADQAAIMGEYFAFTQHIVDSGEMVAGDPLHGAEAATTVTVVDGARLVTDGPFAETKEVLGGYYVVNVDSLDRAHELAAMIPAARAGKVEVRPIMDMSEYAPGASG